MVFNDLTSENYVLYTMKHYDNPQCQTYEEFLHDLKHIKYLKRLFAKFRNNGELRERLVLNHLILIYNVFGQQAGTRILFYKVDEDDYPILKTFLIYLKRMPNNKIEKVNGIEYYVDDIPIDFIVAKALRNLG